MTQPVFDGHNDLLLHLWRAGDRDGRAFFDGRQDGHIDLARARAGGFAGGLFAVFVPGMTRAGALDALMNSGANGDPPDMPTAATDQARIQTLEIASILIRMTRARPDAIRLCRGAGEIEAARAAGAIAAVFHIEGAEGIGPDLDELHVLHAAGLRSLGPVWSRPNIFGHGVPFRFPASPDIGPGLSDAGRRLVRECDALGILVDLSHLNEAGFWEVARLSQAPLVASHSNAHALCPASRNLTDDQLAAIAERQGLVGLNYAVTFLREDGKRIADTPLTLLVRHLDYLLERLGPKGVALGSDFDGAPIPRELGDVAGLPALVGAMRQAGYDDELIDRICWRNWIELIGRINP
ncbi:MAG: membrane dipeptidase [Alphaproteobacteria bacterium]|nr:MAG: membrane dipeptidase [Alphaproteobacteria bacterium]